MRIMISQIVYPKAVRLQKYVEYFWVLEGFSGGMENPGPIVFPEARGELMLSFGAPTGMRFGSGCITEIPGSYFCGIRKQPFTVVSRGQVDYLAVRFYPHALYHFIKIPMCEFGQETIRLDQMDGHFWSGLTERVGNITGITERIQQLEMELLSILDDEARFRSWSFEKAVGLIEASGGSGSMGQICDQLGFYPKRLEREFLKHLGITPKLYSRVVRFNRTVACAEKRLGDLSWSDLSYQCGFSDQSHLIREFLHFLGKTPEEYRILAANSQ